MTRFDPNAAAGPGAGVFGLPFGREESRVVLIPVPFDATTSYRPGTDQGPKAIFAASQQVDLYDHRFGRIYERGIWMAEHPQDIEVLSVETRLVAGPVLAKGGADADDQHAVGEVERACRQVNAFVHENVSRVLERHQTPGIVGGEHGVSLGAIEACAEAFSTLGVLQIDAHMDLRAAFEGFSFSHASIMHNVLERVPHIRKLVQVGVRDYCEEELDYARAAGDRVRTFFWPDIEDELGDGRQLRSIWQEAIEGLPEHVYVSFDIDGLDPSLCPHTGTPVPGGLSFEQASMLLALLKNSGRTAVGFDLVEVAPGPEYEPELDANVGARMLYRMCALAGG